MWRNVRRWRGVILIGAAVVATLWLAVGNQLVLYIHPRYIVFTVIMAAVALVLVVAGSLRGRGEEDDEAPSRSAVGVSVAAVVAGVAVAVVMVALPPATLSSATAGQRDINGSTVAADAQTVSDVESAPVGAFAAFTVKDWSSLLRQTTDLDFYAGKPVDVVGFITADPDDPQNVFYVSRFVVTCCAVDAQPLGVPVYFENWPDSFELDQWVEAKGELGTNPSQHSKQPIALDPDSVTIVEQPSEPYLY